MSALPPQIPKDKVCSLLSCFHLHHVTSEPTSLISYLPSPVRGNSLTLRPTPIKCPRLPTFNTQLKRLTDSQSVIQHFTLYQSLSLVDYVPPGTSCMFFLFSSPIFLPFSHPMLRFVTRTYGAGAPNIPLSLGADSQYVQDNPGRDSYQVDG
jgi:hypothetical protein